MAETGSNHRRSLVVWDVRPAIERGAPFSIRIGVKCEALCEPDGWTLAVHDEKGRELASVIVGKDTWPNTEGLYRAELGLVAPDAEGLFGWRVLAPAIGSSDAGDGCGHGESVADFSVRTVAEAQFRLTVVATARESGEPVNGAKVIVHPYRAVTDERGVAGLDLPRGPFRLFVTRRDFLPLRLDGELTADADVRAELDADIGPSDAERWA